jgi:uncharacterized protein
MPKYKFFFVIFLSTFLIFGTACRKDASDSSDRSSLILFPDTKTALKITEAKSPQIKKVVENALKQIEITKSYNPEYVVISYPNGDVPPEKGVCTDVVIRAFRAAGVDLQKEVHEDMRENFAAYPKKWNLTKPDTNIDHRRVPNLRVYFERKGKSLPVTRVSENYQPGDVVSWDLDEKKTAHIGIVSNIFNERSGRYLIVHNIGAGGQAEDVLFDLKITGHFRYF